MNEKMVKAIKIEAYSELLRMVSGMMEAEQKERSRMENLGYDGDESDALDYGSYKWADGAATAYECTAELIENLIKQELGVAPF